MSHEPNPTDLGPDTVLGIDLGTTYSLVAVPTPRGPAVLRDEAGRALVPSVVAVLPDGTTLVGEPAKALAFSSPERVVHSVKRLIGRSASEVRLEAQRLPYRVVEGRNAQVRVRIPLDGRAGRPLYRDYSPEEISAMVLGDLRCRALLALGLPDDARSLRRAVITVPAYFDEAQRQATKRAAELAQLEVLRLVNEPTAAALAFGLGRRPQATILVYDLGGGTFDVSVLRVQDGVFRVLSTHGDTQLGGDDFDRKILDRLLGEIRQEVGAELSGDPHVLATLRRSAEQLKIRLSDAESAALTIDAGVRPLRFAITRSELEQMLAPEFERTMRSVRAALKDAGLDRREVDDVVLVGGSTRTPAVRRLLAEHFGRPPHTAIDPDLAVALGAAVQASVLDGSTRDLLLLDVVPLSLGLETLGGAFHKLILRNTTVPCSVTEEFSTQVDNQTGIDLNIYQGERELVRDCRHIGAFKLSGIPPMPAGLPRVAVTFTVDQQGLLRVTARELRSGQTASIEILPVLGLSRDDVRRLVAESIEKADEDVRAREALDLRNKAAAVVHGAEAALARGGDGLQPEQGYAIRKALARVKTLLEAQAPLSELRAALDTLSSYTMQLADELIGAAVRKALQAVPASKAAGSEP